MNKIPKLPHGLEPKMVYMHGSFVIIIAEDSNCIHFFTWDGVSVSWEKSESYIKYENS